MEFEQSETDVLIIGAGAAGLRAAIELAENGVNCLVLGKRAHGDAHTALAAGGINASLGSLDPEDDWTLHAADTLREGHFICQPEAVELLARRAPDRVRELADWGCPFDRTGDGAINQRYFGAQSYRRTCFVGDHTGEAILQTLVERASRLEIPFRQNIYITEILVEDGRACGAIGWDMQPDHTADEPAGRAFLAPAVVLAAGGCTGLYNRHSSREDENTGDAMALALAAGASLRDMEFIQFHPTGMVAPEEWAGWLVTEAVRGEGGRLYNTNGDRFMENYAPEEMELAARDVVARAIWRELEAGRGTERGGVYLDISHRDAGFIKERLPEIYQRFDDLGIDIADEPMQVAPTAHYAMGGVKVDFATGRTDLDGLFAVGEAASGLHGANRLGGNSLAETVVFGQLTGEHLVDWIQEQARSLPTLDSSELEARFQKLDARARQHGEHKPDALIGELGQMLERHAGILRDADTLTDGLEELDRLEQRADNLRVYTKPGTRVFEQVCNLAFMLDTAKVLISAALKREESRGAHYREDFPDTDSDWKQSIVCRRTGAGELALDEEPIGPIPDSVREAVDRDVHLDYHHLE